MQPPKIPPLVLSRNNPHKKEGPSELDPLPSPFRVGAALRRLLLFILLSSADGL